MNNLLFKSVLTALWITAHMVNAQEHVETIGQQVAFEKQDADNVFYLANINGNIHAEAYDGEKIIWEATKTIHAKTRERLDDAVSKISVEMIDRYDTLILYIKGPCESFGLNNSSYKKNSNEWCYNWSNCDRNYDYNIDFKLKIPRNLNVYLSTINKGDVVVNGLEGLLNIHNVNGAIRLNKVLAPQYVYTINGDVKVDYIGLPDQSGAYFYTLNGDIEVEFPKGLKADIGFKSYNGDLYTNIAQVNHRAAVVEKKNAADSGLSFKVDTKSMVSVNGGGIAMDFETFNGNVYLREN